MNEYLDKNKHINENGHIRNILYTFKSTKSNLWYIVLVEQYEHDVFAVKFYPKKWRNSKLKYQLLTGTNEPRKIINTCINVMLSVYEKNPNASFGFVGANRINESSSNETKRYKVYSTIVATYFSNEFFFHKENKEKSAYLLINNKALSSNPTLVKDIEDFFKNQYPYFD